MTTLPQDSKERKEFPLYSGTIKYFPSALASVAKVCKIGNDKHNPGQPLHHARGKSGDHADCIVRHLIDMEEDFGKGKGFDEQGIPQVAYIAWRALALAQEWLEKNQGVPLAPGAKLATPHRVENHVPYRLKHNGWCIRCQQTCGLHTPNSDTRCNCCVADGII